MRKFNITVNGVSYEVEVEEITDNASQNTVLTPAPAVKDSKPAPLAKSSSAAKPASKPAPTAKPASATAVPEGATTVEAPMSGNIWKIEVEEGQEIKSGDVLVILEAMKMENEILAPVDGVVASIHVAQGAAVNGGDILLSIK